MSKVFIATPSYDDKVNIGYLESIVKMIDVFKKYDIQYIIKTISGEAMITRARNALVAEFLGHKDCTHLMFIDSDITFDPLNIVRMVKLDKPVIGGAYPIKRMNYDNIISLLKEDVKNSKDTKDVEDVRLLVAKSFNYAINMKADKRAGGEYKVEDGSCIQVDEIATGFMLIRRDVFDTLISKFPEKKYKNNQKSYDNEFSNDNFYAFFDCLIHPESKLYLSEDYGFCYLVRNCGYCITVDISINLCHTGIHHFGGSFSTKFT